MRLVALLAPAALTGGCSLLYNPSNIDKPRGDAAIIDMGEVAVDVEIRADANPIDMVLTDAFPPTINEGAGTGGARAEVVVLRGKQFVKDASSNLMVMLAPSMAGLVTLDSHEVSGNGDYIALAVSVPVSTACEHGTTVQVAVTVMQNDGAGGTVSKTLADAFAVTCLDQLTAAPTTAAGLRALYSKIDISGPVNVTAGVQPALILRSASSINIGNIDASGTDREPGPAGGRGATNGGSTEAATGPGAGATASDGSAAGGGGAGYVSAGTTPANGGAGGAMTGDVWISSYTTNRSSGGGAGGTLALGGAGNGGGGGGTVELSAAGTLMVGTITADGGAGKAGTGTVAAGDGAGGSGGTVLLRSFGMFTGGGVISVAPGGPGGGGSTNAGTSSAGRIRADLAAGTHPGNAQKGPIIVDLPVKVTVQTPQITVRGKGGDNTSTLRVFDKNAVVVNNETHTPVFGGGDPSTATVMPTLRAGYNRVCVWVTGGLDSVPESANCQTVAYLPP